MAQQETEQLTRILISPALARAVSTIAELGIADLLQAGQPQPVEHLARASKTHEPTLYRILRFMAGYGLFQESEDRHFDHTLLSAALRSDAPGSYRAAAQTVSPHIRCLGGSASLRSNRRTRFQQGFRCTDFRIYSDAS